MLGDTTNKDKSIWQQTKKKASPTKHWKTSLFMWTDKGIKNKINKIFVSGWNLNRSNDEFTSI